MIVTKKHLPRRTFLRGALGTMMAMPFLDAMIPALSAQAKARPMRFGAIYIPNGIYPQQWHPETAGSAFEFKPVMQPLEAYPQPPGDHQRHEGARRQPRHGRRAHGRQRRVAQRHRAGHRDGEVRRAVEEVDRPVHRRRDCRGHAAAVARSGHRGHGHVGRRVRRLPVRVLQRHLVARRQEPAAGRRQPARDVRAHVRRDRLDAEAHGEHAPQAEPARLGGRGSQPHAPQRSARPTTPSSTST